MSVHHRVDLPTFLRQQYDSISSSTGLEELASAAGFERAQTLQLILDGEARLPLDRVRDVAHAFDCDPRFLFRLTLHQIMPDAHAVDELLGPCVTRNEIAWLEFIRAASDYADPRVTLERVQKVRLAFHSSS